MKNTFRKTGLLFIILFVLIINSCKKEVVPALTTVAISNILGISATSGGTITSEGSSTVLSRGVCWSTGTTPTIADNKTADGAGAGSFTSSITGLNGATSYYVRAYATNSVGTGYGMAMSFTTLGQSPTPTSAAASNINVTTATLNGSVNANYLSTVVTFEYGTSTSYGSTASTTQSPLTGNIVTNVSADITGLTAGTIYHFRIKAVNSLGTTYGSDLTFTSLGMVPTVTSLAATNVSTTSASVNGSVNANYLSSVVTFEYGTTTSYGSTITATQSPVSGNSVTNVSANITSLTPGTIYHFRVKAVNSLGTSNGSDLTFTTLGQVPSATTLIATNITQSGATINGSVNANYLSTTIIFEYGLSSSYGQTITAVQSPLSGNGFTTVGASITGLAINTIYHYRVSATNSLGTTTGIDMTFTTGNSANGLFTVKTGTDELYFINISTLSMTKIANIGVALSDMFSAMQYKDSKLYIVTAGKLYTYDLKTGTLTLVITNSKLQWQFSINSAGDLYSVTEISGPAPGTMYKINIVANTYTTIGSTNTPSLWGMGFDSNDKLWAIDEFLQQYGSMNISTGQFTASSSVVSYTDAYYATPDNNGNLYSFNVGIPTGIVKYNIASNTATLFMPLSVTWAGLAYGQY